ncbi:MAG: YqaA family protein [Gammaproteobacteria bacterium]|jgi:membrane protein YqaA with SNARE-associated domain|nr:YqaA family protein [Gammaproteobacteria bacterium]MDP6615818.1 YqaA family protein [Gammaproteobacteria bacterium]MDP6694364.1 YqaA family protein [Gammaproteobacteria bacterium]MDP7041440.1 YqaA family protein [Gammaproteobacteria bacterium]
MKLFSRLFELVLRWSRHPKAPWYLGGLSFAESSFFPIPPDVMLMPMVVAQPDKAWRFATLTTVTSVAGGLAGFLIGVLAIDAISPVLRDLGYWDAYERAHAWFREWGFWAVLAAGFSPIPYKIFTIAAGAMGMPVLPFFLSSLAGRASRFYLVAGLLFWGGPRVESALRRYVDIIGWIVVALIVVGYFLFRS